MSTALPLDFSRFLEQTFGGKRYSLYKDFLHSYSQDTSHYGAEPLAVVFPDTVEELRKLVIAANASQVRLYPISQGKNWGYGSGAPSAEACVVIDLSKMNKIVEVNTRDAYCLIEPGVSQQQLYDHLAAHFPQFMMDVTGSATNASIVGNVLERGFGATLLADRTTSTLGMEAILPNGELIRSGFARFPGAKLPYAFPYGIGPAVVGLFTQSNLCIVTKVAVALQPKPERFGIYLFQVKEVEQIFPMMERYNALALNGATFSSFKIGNFWRSLSILRQFPWNEAEEKDGKYRLSNESIRKLLGEYGMTPWAGMLAVYSSKEEFRTHRRMLKAILRNANKVVFVTPRRLRFGKWLARRANKFLPKHLKSQLELILASTDLMLGKPSDHFLRGVYWRSRHPWPEKFDPVADKIGLYWFSPILPAAAEDLRAHLDIVQTVFDEYGFEPQMTLNQFGARYVVSVISLCYDKESASEREAAKKCYETLLSRHLESGYFPYRTGPTSSETIMGYGDNAYNELLRTLKDAIDPNEILSPGRYIPEKR